MTYMINEVFEEVIDGINRQDHDNKTRFADYDDYENEYSHNQIDEVHQMLIKKLNKYFNENNMSYVAYLNTEWITVVDLNTYEQRYGTYVPEY